MQSIDALICPRWTLRVEPEVVAEEGLAVAVDAGRIVDVLPVDHAERRYRPRVRHERPTHALLPGLVNAHTHSPMALFRGFADDLPLEIWLREHIWPAEARWVGPELVADGTRLAIAEMLAGGITCFSDMYFHADVTGTVDLGMSVSPGRIRVEVADPGSGFAHEVTAPAPGDPGGWGLYLVDQIADDWGIDTTSAGTSVWFVLRYAARA